jgi:hypothetical protein
VHVVGAEIDRQPEQRDDRGQRQGGDQKTRIRTGPGEQSVVSADCTLLRI